MPLQQLTTIVLGYDMYITVRLEVKDVLVLPLRDSPTTQLWLREKVRDPTHVQSPTVNNVWMFVSHGGASSIMQNRS